MWFRVETPEVLFDRRLQGARYSVVQVRCVDAAAARRLVRTRVTAEDLARQWKGTIAKKLGCVNYSGLNNERAYSFCTNVPKFG